MVDPTQPGDPAPEGRRPLSREGNRPPPRRFGQDKESRAGRPNGDWDDEKPDDWKDDWKKDDWPKQRSSGKPPEAPLSSAAAPLDAAYKMVGPVLMGMVIGYFLDNYLQTRPWWFLGMTAFGLVTGFWSLLKPLYLKPADAGTRVKDAPEGAAEPPTVPPEPGPGAR